MGATLTLSEAILRKSQWLYVQTVELSITGIPTDMLVLILPVPIVGLCNLLLKA